MTEERVKRKLSAILSADVVGYSRLMGEDEVSTVRTLEAYRKVMSDLIEQFRGRVVDSPGDNLLSEFSSVVDAVQCAVEIHEVIRAKNEALPEDRRMLFRIGVNLGDVIEEGDRIYGDGVNIAARLEGLAEAGGICISGSAHEQIKNKLAFGYEYIGEHTVKNIAAPLKVYRVPMGAKTPISKEGDEKKTKLKSWQWTTLGAAGAIIVIIAAVAIWKFYPRGPSVEPASIESEQAPVIADVKEAPKSIAVLPFDDLSPEKDQEYFVLGLSEEILNSLAQIEDLTVIAKTSSFSFKGTNKTIQEIASVLGVENILEGSVRKAGNALRITTQLVKAVDGSHLWSKTYNRELKDIFAVQEDIATSVADELKVTLGIGKFLKRLGGTENLEAYEQYLIAQGKMGDYDTYNTALIPINKAIEMDPKFALAWATKAWLHNFISISAPSNQTASERDVALNAAQRAIDLEPNLAAGYYSLGFTKMSKGDWIQAGSSFYKAIDLQNEALWSEGIMQAAIHYLAVANFQKSYELHDKARQNDPLHPIIRANYMANLGVLVDIRRVEEEYERCKELFGGHWIFGDSYIRIHRLGTTAIVFPEEKDSQVPSWDPIGDKVSQYIGTPEKGLAELYQLYTENNSLSSKEFIYISVWAAYFGDPEFAIEAMEKGVSLEASGLFWVWIPVMKGVRQLPRFKEFVREIGLVDYWNQFGWPDICRPVGDDDFVCD